MQGFTHFTPVAALEGGALIGLAASGLLLFTGRVAGISGILDGFLRPSARDWGWRATFLAGLLASGAALLVLRPTALVEPIRSLGVLTVAGLLVGFGSRMGSGCTSGHGVCGISRFSLRSLVATLTFMATGIATVTLVRILGAP
jgi:uncharacterized membrane protein YedE/YeeE